MGLEAADRDPIGQRRVSKEGPPSHTDPLRALGPTCTAPRATRQLLLGKLETREAVFESSSQLQNQERGLAPGR